MDLLEFRSTADEVESDIQREIHHMLEQKERMEFLTTRSPKLAEICLQVQQNNFDIIKAHGLSVEVFNLILCYVFNDELKTNSPKELIEVAKAAHKCEMSDLVRLCKHHVTNCSIDKYNAWSLIDAARYLKLEALGKRCFQFLETLSTEVLFEMPEFFQITQDTLLYVLNNRDILIGSDVLCMEIIIRWLQHHKRRSRSLLSAIQTFSLDYNEFLDLIEKYPKFFTSKETSRVLFNMLRPGMFEVPPWCEMELKNDKLQLFTDYSDIVNNALKIELKCNNKFPKSLFHEEDTFEGSVIFEIKLAKHFPRMPYLVMMELGFGSSYVPRSNLELELYHCDQGALLVKKKINFFLKVTENHYYLMVKNQMRLQKNIPFVFILKLRANGLKNWGADGPISNRQYRVAQIPEDIFENICLDAGDGKAVCITLLSDWMIFVDPKGDEKRHVLTTFYFDSIRVATQSGKSNSLTFPDSDQEIPIKRFKM